MAASPAVAQMAAPQAGDRSNLEVFLVEDVAVDATAGNAVEAREKAIAEGQMRALQTLLMRLTPESEHARLPQPSARDVQFMVLGVSINDERTSAVRYVGNISVQFIPQTVTALLDHASVTYATDSRPVLVLPVYRDGPNGTPVLWEEPNPWRHLWGGRPVQGLVRIEVPQGDYEDITAIDVTRALGLDASALAILADRYAAAETVVAEATMGNGPNGELTVALTATRADGSVLNASVGGTIGEPQDAVLARAADALNSLLEGGWKQEALAFGGPTTALTAVVPIASLEDWLTLRDRLQNLQQIRSLDVKAISRDTVQVVLQHVGDQQQLATLLGDQGVGLESRGSYAILRRGAVGRVSPQSPPPVNAPPARILPLGGGQPANGGTIIIQ